MAVICYHASHEQFAPSHLLKLVELAGNAGFGAIHSSDHFHPWSERQGNSGNSFCWLGAAMQVTNIPFSVVCAPGQRYHPAVLAQSVATLEEMFPARFSIELGSGEAINEMITGEEWPEYNIRNRRLYESAIAIRELLEGKEVSRNGLIKIKNAKLYTLPLKRPQIFCAAISDQTAEWAGSWADGLLTTGGSTEDLTHKMNLFFENGGKGKPVFAQYSFSYGKTKEAAIDGAFDQWRSNMVGMDKLKNLDRTAYFDQEAERITKTDIEKNIPIFTSMEQVFEIINKHDKCGIDRFILHNVNREQEQFIEDFGKYFTGSINNIATNNF